MMLNDPSTIMSPNGQQIVADSVYTETELRYYIDFIEKMAMKKYREDLETPQEM
jgi:hypothetical protein